jgi:hypothetical protein
MTSRFKDFGEGSGPVEKTPLSFKLYGEDFHCYPAVQGSFMLSLIADSSSDDPVKATEVVVKFFDRVLLPESQVRFENLLKDPEKIVSVDTLAEITAWLMEEYTERPNQQPEVSSPGQ